VQLDYEIQERSPGRIVLEDEPPRHTLTFPQTPRWLVIVGIVSALGLGTFQLAGLGWLTWMLWSFNRTWGMSALVILRPMMLMGIVGPFIPIACGWFALRSFRRYGHLPRKLSLDVAKCRLSHRPERNPCWREWPLSAIASVRLSPIHNLLGHPAGAALSIRLRRRLLPIGARCRQRDVEQFRAFAAELSQQLPGRVTIRLDGGG
jgi:hypothetical protein